MSGFVRGEGDLRARGRVWRPNGLRLNGLTNDEAQLTALYDEGGAGAVLPYDMLKPLPYRCRAMTASTPACASGPSRRHRRPSTRIAAVPFPDQTCQGSSIVGQRRDVAAD